MTRTLVLLPRPANKAYNTSEIGVVSVRTCLEPSAASDKLAAYSSH